MSSQAISATGVPVAGTDNGSGATLSWNTFGFTIPVGSSIDGISISITHTSNHDSGTQYIGDTSARLLLFPGVATGSNYAVTTGGAQGVGDWPTGSTVVVYGTGSTDLWGTTPSVNDINSNTFGFELHIAGTKQNGSETGTVTAVTITVYYTPGAGVGGGAGAAGCKIGFMHHEPVDWLLERIGS